MTSTMLKESTGPNIPKRICLYGGTFDPIHLGHTHIAKAAHDRFKFEQVIFLPCKQSPHKTKERHAAKHHRLAMCKLAITDLDWANVDDFDLNTPEPCYSWRVVEAMQNQFLGAQLFWLMGSDQWQALHKWNRPDHLAELVEFIVFSRGATPIERSGFQMHAIHGAHPASATIIRENTPGRQQNDWLHPEVLKYIKKHQLYHDAAKFNKADD